MVRPRFAAGIAIGLMVAALAWVGWLLVGTWQVRDGLAWARRQVAEGRYAPARSRLARLSAWWPRRGEVEYLLGVCEAALGRPEDALVAWGRVPAGSPPAAATALARGRTLQALGRL